MKTPAIAVVSLVFCLTALSSRVAMAGPYADEMAKCLVQSTTDADKADLVKWNKLATQDAIKYEGPATFHSSFNVLGQAAAHSLFSAPNIARGVAELGNQLDKEKFERVFGPMNPMQ